MITNSLTGAPLADVTITTTPVVDGPAITTGVDGTYTADLPVGAYAIAFAKPNYAPQSKPASVLAAQTTTSDAALVPVAKVVVNLSVQGAAQPGSTLNATASITPLDGSQVESVTWSQTTPLDVVFGSPQQATTTVGLPDVAAFKDHLFTVIEEPPITEEELPPNVDIDIPTASSGLLDRFLVQGINPFALEEAGLITLQATVVTSSGTYTQQAAVHTALPWKVNPGLENVALKIPVLLHGKDLGEDATYDWQLAAPGTSTATLTDAATQNPYFTPDIAGLYTVTVTDTTASPNALVTLSIRAGNWVGAITGQDINGNPESANCTTCHNDVIAPDRFTDWARSGHAHIFSDNLNTSPYYNTACLTCHSVGYDPEVSNGGFDDAPGFQSFLEDFTSDGTRFIANPNNWSDMLSMYPDVAKLANAQCDSCHGPNSTGFHANGKLDAQRISTSADVCATCHGEPARHARFQQWQLSRHSNYDRARSQGTNAACASCHSAQGFIQWSKQGFSGRVSAPTADTVHPQTCATCHDPHYPGATSGEPNTATVRVSGNTPLLQAGFTARNVGRGAVCMVCHNTRRGLKNDVRTPTNNDRSPHAGAQTDLLMGQNAFFVQVGQRGKHSLITDTCTNCHMQQTDPPADLAYQLSGTNHTFQPSTTICQNCHDSIDGDEVQASTEAEVDYLSSLLEEAVMRLLTALANDGNVVNVTGLEDANGQPLPNVDIMPGDTVIASHFHSGHGSQSVDLTLNGDVVGAASLDSMTVFGGQSVFQTTTQGQVIVKAGWNLLLVEEDKSGGIHNPSFAFEVLAASQQRLADTDFTRYTLRNLEDTLSGAQEVPPVQTTASGNIVLDLNEPRTVVNYRLELDGIEAGTVTGAHIHLGAKGTNGPVIFFFCTDPGTAPGTIPVPSTCDNLPAPLTGTLTAANLIPQPDLGINTFEDAVGALLLGDTYVNVHTETHPDGLVRGQVSLL